MQKPRFFKNGNQVIEPFINLPDLNFKIVKCAAVTAILSSRELFGTNVNILLPPYDDVPQTNHIGERRQGAINPSGGNRIILNARLQEHDSA